VGSEGRAVSTKAASKIAAFGTARPIALIVAGLALFLSSFVARAESETMPHIRDFCALRYPEALAKRSECEKQETRAAQELFELIEDVERGTPAFVASDQCIERSRLKKAKKTKQQKAAVNWTRALECVEAYFASLDASSGDAR
jgi:hypothetical protein